MTTLGRRARSAPGLINDARDSLPSDLSAYRRPLACPMKRSSRLVDFMLRWCAKGSRRLLDVVLDPADELGVSALPLLEPGLDIRPRLLKLPSAAKPSELGHAVVISLTRQMIVGVAQEVYVATLPGDA